MNRIKKAFVVGIPWIGFVGFLIVFLSIVHGAYATFTTYGTFSGNLSGPSEIGIFFGGLLCLLCAPFLFFACIPVFKGIERGELRYISVGWLYGGAIALVVAVLPALAVLSQFESLSALRDEGRMITYVYAPLSLLFFGLFAFLWGFRKRGQGVGLDRFFGTPGFQIALYVFLALLLFSLTYNTWLQYLHLFVESAMVLALGATAYFYEAGRNIRLRKTQPASRTFASFYVFVGLILCLFQGTVLHGIQATENAIRTSYDFMGSIHYTVGKPSPFESDNSEPGYLFLLVSFLPAMAIMAPFLHAPIRLKDRLQDASCTGLVVLILQAGATPVSYTGNHILLLLALALLTFFAVGRCLPLYLQHGLPAVSGHLRGGAIWMLLVLATGSLVGTEFFGMGFWKLSHGLGSYSLQLCAVPLLLATLWNFRRGLLPGPPTLISALTFLLGFFLALGAWWLSYSHRSFVVEKDGLFSLHPAQGSGEEERKKLKDRLSRYTHPAALERDAYFSSYSFSFVDGRVQRQRDELIYPSEAAPQCDMNSGSPPGYRFQFPPSAHFSHRVIAAGTIIEADFDTGALMGLAKSAGTPILTPRSDDDPMNSRVSIRLFDALFFGFNFRNGRLQEAHYIRDSCGKATVSLVENQVFTPEIYDKLTRLEDQEFVPRPGMLHLHKGVSGNPVAALLRGQIVRPMYKTINENKEWYFYRGWASGESLMDYQVLMESILDAREAGPGKAYENTEIRSFFNDQAGFDHLRKAIRSGFYACRSADPYSRNDVFVSASYLLTDADGLRFVSAGGDGRILDPRITYLDAKDDYLSDLQLEIDTSDATELNPVLGDDLRKWRDVSAADFPGNVRALLRVSLQQQCGTAGSEETMYVPTVIVDILDVQYESELFEDVVIHGKNFRLSRMALTEGTARSRFCHVFANRPANEEEAMLWATQTEGIPDSNRALCIK